MGWVAPVRTVFLCASLALGCAACGGSELVRPERPSNDHRTWHTELPPRPTDRAFVPIRLPDARNTRLETRADYDLPYLVLNFLPDGDIYFKGQTWDMGGDEDERQRAHVSLQAEMIEWHAVLHQDPRWRDEERRSRMPIALHGDRATAWANLTDALALLDTPKLRNEHIHFAVSRWTAPHRDMCIAGRLRPLLDRTPGTTITLELKGPEDARQTKLVLRFPDQGYSFRFPPSNGLEVLRAPSRVDRRWLAHTNMVWGKIREVLAERSAVGPRAAILVPAPADVEFGYVLTAIDLLLGRGIHDIDFPNQAFGLQLRKHADEDPAEPGLQGGPWLPMWLIVLIALLALGVPLLGFLGRRPRTRPARGR